ncbi:PAS domain S-box protein [Archangium violaceum]|uniref:PAS domain S-box protein n=1 Tax=Archangium violaceum TaxID=83451 RepID=UPI0019508CC3|nr:PAS domain S-box protein [Archangium violaceum]QRN97248.1 PAS domain S-box protein [Archangium violaceum]
MLVVDDTEAKRYLIAQTLRLAGMEVVEAATGQEALAAMVALPEVVVLDARLPDMSGFDVCRQLKQDPATAAIPVLYISALLRDEELERRLFEDGADGYIPQPIEPKHLVAQTWALVRMRRAERARQREREQAQVEHQRLQHELAKSQARAQRLSESGVVGTLYWDLDGSVLDANDTFLAMVGYTREELAQGRLDWRKMTPPEWEEPDRQNVEVVKRHGVGPMWEKQYVRKDGSRVDILLGSALLEGESRRGVSLVVDITARREAERKLTQLMAELESKERLLQAVLHQMPTGVLIVEAPSGRMLLSNERLVSILGASAVPMGGVESYRWELTRYPHGQRYQLAELPMVRALGGEVVLGEELVVHRDDGRQVLSRVNAAPVRDAEGRIVASVLTLEDITEQKATQESLRLSEERLRLALDSAALGVWRHDPTTGAMEWDARTKELFGLSPNARTGLDRWLEIVHPEDHERVRELSRRAFSGENGGLYDTEYRVTGPRDRGVMRWLASRGRAHVDADGRRWLMGTVRDITERKLSEQRAADLQATTAIFAQALTPRQVADAVMAHGLRALDAYAGAVSIVEGQELLVLSSVGYPESIVQPYRGIPLSLRTPPTDAARTGRMVWVESHEAFERGWPDVARRLHDSRSRAWGSIPLVSGDRVVGVLGLSFSTPRRLSEREKAHLESLCRLCAQALERARLFEETRRRSELEQQFLGMVSHDLRNPLQAISLGARTLQRLEKPTPEALLRMAGRIANSADTMGRMISDLLDFTRGRLGGGIPLERTESDLMRLCREVIDEFTVTHPSSDIRLEGDGSCEGWWDGTRMRQVLSNLLSNALRHARAGTPVVVRASGKGGEASLAVSNEGEPVPAELLPVLFEPFRRGMSKFRPSGSLGLGLYIVRQVVEGHGGKVEVETGAAGTTFLVRVPCGTEPVSVT